MEQNARPTADSLFSASISDNPKTRLNILITASIAGERAASISSLPDTSTIRSGVPRGASRTRMRDRVSSHIFFISSPLRPMMLPTFPTGTMRRNTQSPGHPSHLLSGGGAAAVVSASPSAGGCAAETLSGDSRLPAEPFWSGCAVAI
ncbi:hypothetical protein V8G54_007466 [Vigna mungo]|uniref:Uncharacterized protein n=1 Tax=Vigna mungo TaxID=3915 RepID=A0AAQ3P1P3_VIGMU